VYTNLDLAAPDGALAFLGTGFLLFLIGLVYSLIKKKFGLRKFALRNGRTRRLISLRLTNLLVCRQREGACPWAGETLLRNRLPIGLLHHRRARNKDFRGGESLTHFVIGHENSPLHKKTAFQI
jgi:hypothetical protein